MTILGIDPGTATTGYGVIGQTKNNNWKAVAFGVIATDKRLTDSQRLKILADDVTALIKKYNPAAAGVEKLFFTTNQKTAITVAQARGVILETLERHGVRIQEFTPLQVKSMLTGYGKAGKKQVQYMIQHTFQFKTAPRPDDAADALAIALCCAFQHNSSKLQSGTRRQLL